MEAALNPRMRLRMAKQRTAEQQNFEPQNNEGWNRCALPFESIKFDRIPSFDIRHSLFDIRYSCLRLRKAAVSFSIKLAASNARGSGEL